MMCIFYFYVQGCFQLNLTSQIVFGGGYFLQIFNPVRHNLDKADLDCYTDKKENTIFLFYKEIQMRAVAKSYRI
jgi:hypothetical protein